MANHENTPVVGYLGIVNLIIGDRYELTDIRRHAARAKLVPLFRQANSEIVARLTREGCKEDSRQFVHHHRAFTPAETQKLLSQAREIIERPDSSKRLANLETLGIKPSDFHYHF
jgi:hypothetical protein